MCRYLQFNVDSIKNMTLRQGLVINFHIFLIVFCAFAARSHSEPAPGPFYTTCDFDLENLEALLQYLPPLCTQIYKNRQTDGGLYDSYVEESKAFASFRRKLSDYELRLHQNHEEELEEYPFDTALRRDIYARVDLIDCVTSVNGTAQNFLKCVKGKHSQMAELVPNVAR